jgi:hypothetical protein
VRQFFFVYNAICRSSLRLQFCSIRASKQSGKSSAHAGSLVTDVSIGISLF